MKTSSGEIIGTRLLSLPELKCIKGIGFSRPHLDRLIKVDKVPRPIKNSVRWSGFPAASTSEGNGLSGHLLEARCCSYRAVDANDRDLGPHTSQEAARKTVMQAGRRR